MSNITYRQLIKKLKKRGFLFLRQAKGSHEIWSDGDQKILVPKHPGNIPTGTIVSIVKHAGFENLKDFENFSD